MRLRVPANVLIGVVAVAAAVSTSVVIAWRASNATIAAGFWWEEGPFALSVDDARKMGGPLRPDELMRMQ